MDNTTNYKAKFIQKCAMKEGDVVSAQLWNSILNTIISTSNDHAQTLQLHDELLANVPVVLESITALQNAWSAWREKYSNILSTAEKVAEDAQDVFDIYRALSEGLVHVGEEPPTNPKIKIWIHPAGSFVPIESGVGQATPHGGEIFNDYQNNCAVSNSSAHGTATSAGAMGYKVRYVNINNVENNRIYITILGQQSDFKYITYDNTHPETSTVVSFQIENCYNFAGHVTYTQFTNAGADSRLTLIVQLSPEYNAQAITDEFNNATEPDNVLWIPAYPMCGNTPVGDNAFAMGISNRANYQGAFAGGKNNIADGKYSFVTGKNNRAGHAAAVYGTDNNGYGQGCFVAGSQNEVRGIFAFAHGLGLIVNSAKKTVFGFFNDVTSKYTDKYTIFTVGNGKDNANRSNALDIYNDGSAELGAQGTSDNSIVIKSYVDARFAEIEATLNAQRSETVEV